MHTSDKNLNLGYRYLKNAIKSSSSKGVYSIEFEKNQSYGRTISSAINLLKKMPEIKALLFLNVEQASTPLISHKKESVRAILECGRKNRLRRPKVGKSVKNVFLRSLRKMMAYKKQPQKTLFKKVVVFEKKSPHLKQLSNSLDKYMPKKIYFAPRQLLKQSCQ